MGKIKIKDFYFAPTLYKKSLDFLYNEPLYLLSFKNNLAQFSTLLGS